MTAGGSPRLRKVEAVLRPGWRGDRIMTMEL
jgi:hypothetical protein